MDCMMCGTCCVAPDIHALNKPLGVPCSYLGSDYRCQIYDARPEVCRRYLPDGLCVVVSAPSLSERVEKYLKIFSL